jgi:Right handed beta helix region
MRIARGFPHRFMNCLVLLLAVSALYGWGADSSSKRNAPSSQSCSMVVTPATAQNRAEDRWHSRTTNYYVNAETGDDSYDGTAPTHAGGGVGPWLTLRRAGLTATAGATVHVADGTYRVDGTIGSTTSIETRNSGTPNAWITYVSDNKWGAKIVNTNVVNGPDNIAWAIEGDYQIVKDFDISGGPYTGIFVDANHVKVIGNHLHDISSTSCVAGSFIYVNSPHQYVDTIGNVMHDGGTKPWPSDCGYWHGVYYGGVTDGPVRHGRISNNIIYRVSGWGIHFWHKVSHIDVSNNLIFSNVHGGILIGASDGSTNDYFHVNNNMVIYNSNMLDNKGGPGSLGWGISEYVSDGGTIGPHNSYLNNLVYENHASNAWGGNWANQAAGTNPSGVISGTVIADPLLTNYQDSPAVPTISHGKIVFSGADYHPTPISPAKNVGDCTSTPATDIDGAARSQGDACDIGPN